MANVSTNVYDILFPSPPDLKEIVYVSIAVQLWRQEINAHRIKNTLSQLNLAQNILSSYSLPGVAAADLSAIEKYVRRVGLSIKQWLRPHSHQDLFKMENFHDLIDFAVNFDGTINHVKTAQRIANCEKIEPILRFKIACRVCLENDISRIWPLVQSHVDLNSIAFQNNPILYYWICRLKNRLYRILLSHLNGSSIEEKLLNNTLFSAPAVKFFWDRLDPDSRMRLLARPRNNLYKAYKSLISTFNEVELHKFANKAGLKIIISLLYKSGDEYYSVTRDDCYGKTGVFDEASKVQFTMSFWTRIKTRIDESAFFKLVRKIIERLHDPLENSFDMSTICKLWNSAGDNLKQYAIRQLLLENSLFQRYQHMGALDIDGLFILTVVSDASAEDRSAFWDKHWRSLIDVMCTKDFDQLMRLGFSNDENQIIDFKQNTLPGLAQVGIKITRLLNNLLLEALDQFLSFCYPDKQTRKNVQINMLRNEFNVNVRNITKISPALNDFINDAYDDANLAEQFKTQFLFSPSTVATFTELIELPGYGCGRLSAPKVNFIDILAPSDESVARHLKKVYFLPVLKQKLQVGNFKGEIVENEFSNFIQECFTTEEETAESREKLSIDEIVQLVIRNAIFGNMCPKYNSFLVQFLEWYFIIPQALEEFKAKYADDEIFILLTTKSE